MEQYINPFVDYGFKKLFGTEGNKDLLISLLNALLGEEDDPIMDIIYKNVEQIGEITGTRTNYFDVYCNTESGREFIVEMQNTWKPYFKDRTLYYAAKPIRDQGKHGIQKAQSRPQGWNHVLKDVYLVAVMNFNLPNNEYPEDSYYHKIKLMDVEDHHVFYEKLTLIYLEMPKVGNVKPDLGTMRGKWMYALDSLYYNDTFPEELDDPIFRKLFHQAELARLTPEQDLAYERSMKVYLDTYNEIEGAKMIGREEGLVEGKELGIKEEKLSTARKLLEKGMRMEEVCELTGLTAEEIEE